MENSKSIKLFKVEEGKLIEIINVVVQKGKPFGFLFYPDYQGIYVVGAGNSITGKGNHSFYFKEGDQLDFTINDTTYVLRGNLNSKANQFLKQWHDLKYPIYSKSLGVTLENGLSTFADFFPQLEKIAAKSKEFLARKITGHAQTDNKIKDFVEMDLAYFAINFLFTPRTAHPDLEQLSPFYNLLNATKTAQNAEKVYGYPYGQRALHTLIRYHIRKQKTPEKSGFAGVSQFVAFVPSDTLKGNIVVDFLAKEKTYDKCRLLLDQYGQYIITQNQQKTRDNILSPLQLYKKGSDAFQFAYPDKNGRTVTMASLKGKVILVDVWATWCAPCKAEIPFLKKLEEDLKEEAIQIVSLSIDDMKDKGKWLKTIDDEKLGGLQLFANGSKNGFSDYYKISTIPRFLVFGKDGKVVTVDAPRPSDPYLKDLLLAEAKK